LYSERTIQPVIGARHPVVEDDSLAFFFSEVRYALDEELPPKTEAKGDRIRKRSHFLLYDDPERSGISILEQRLARRHAQQNRLRWTRNDVGRIQGEIQNEFARLELSGRTLPVTFDSVVRLGDADERKARKLALVPEQESDISEFFCSEHEIAINGLSGSMQRFRYPYSGDWIPHLTIGRIFKEIHPNRVNDAVAVVKRFMPLTIEVDPIKFYAEQEVTPYSPFAEVGIDIDADELG
jgi:hypothetical protein